MVELARATVLITKEAVMVRTLTAEIFTACKLSVFYKNFLATETRKLGLKQGLDPSNGP
jgi:hypothetical protein